MRRPLLVIVGLLALAAGVPLLFDAPAEPLSPLPSLPSNNLGEMMRDWPEVVEGSARWARLSRLGQEGQVSLRGLPRHLPVPETVLASFAEAAEEAGLGAGPFSLVLDRFAELEPAMAARDALQEAGLTVYVLPIFPGEGAGDALGYDLALGPRLQGAALWAQRETLKARFGYDGTLVYFRAVKPGSTP